MTSQMTPLDLDKLEGDAKRAAMKQVANMLQRPDQLEKIDQYKRRVARKKASVETMLKTAMQSQLDGVRNGLNQLQTALTDIALIRQSLEEVDSTYRSMSELQERLKTVQTESSRHRQLGAAVENLKHIFTVPETVKKTSDYIAEGRLLLAHKCLSDLEASRDEMLAELHKQPTQSVTDRNMIHEYFKDVDKLSSDLSKQLWIVLQRTLSTVRREPTIIVTVLRIIEREEKADAVALKREKQTSFLPQGRPKKWRQKAFQVLEKTVSQKMEGCQLDDRTDDKMWLVKHLELIRQITSDDLKVVKSLCEPCFPPEYDIINKFVNMYHNMIKEHIQDLIQDLQGNEVVSLLTWTNSYKGRDMMGNPELRIDTPKLSPILDEVTIQQLQQQYLQTMRKNIQEWTTNSLRSDIADWYKEAEPEQDGDGCFNTPLPVILFQMFEQNLQVAAHIKETLVVAVLNLCVEEMQTFSRQYSQEIRDYKDMHLQDRSKLRFYTNFMIANINNCSSFIEFTCKMMAKYCKGDIDETDMSENKLNTLEKTFDCIAREGCTYLLEEVVMDLKQHYDDILTRKWLTSNIVVETICITIEDYCQDFFHLKKKFLEDMMAKAQYGIIVQYIKAFTASSKRISFKNYEERKTAAEKAIKEADQYQKVFSKLTSQELVVKLPWKAIYDMAEVIKLKDPTVLSLEVSALYDRFPDARLEQLINLLQLRGDITKSDSKAMIHDTIGEEQITSPKSEGVFTSAITA